MLPDGYDALLYIKRLHDRGQAVNVILTEIRNNGVGGVQATTIIKDEFPEIAILVLTDNSNDSYVMMPSTPGQADISPPGYK